MRSVLVGLLVLASCWHEPSPSATRAPTRNHTETVPPTDAAVASKDRGRTMPSLGPPTCAGDADCRVSYAGPACCPPEPSCGGVVSVGQIAAFAAYCKGVDCGPPRPSSSCMGIIGLRAVCQQGTCVGVR